MIKMTELKMSANVIKLRRFISTKTILITGSNEGIGFETSLALASQNHKIILADKEDLSRAKDKIVQSTCNENIVTKYIDFTSLSSIRNFARDLQKEQDHLDVLINNVGVFCLGKERTEDGLQAAMQVNHFGPFLLTHLLTELLVKSAPSRVLFVSSLGAFFHKLTLDNINNPEITPWDGLSSLLIYYNSKLCNIITANGFAKRLNKHGVRVNSLHPGMTATTFLWKHPIVQNPFKCFIQDPVMGAQSSIFLSTSEHVADASGKFFVDMKVHQQPRITTDERFCNALWGCSEDFVEMKQEERL